MGGLTIAGACTMERMGARDREERVRIQQQPVKINFSYHGPREDCCKEADGLGT